MSPLALFIGALLAESLHQAIGHRTALLHAAAILPAWVIHRARRQFVNTGARVKARPVKAAVEQPAITTPTRLELTA